MNQLPGCIHVKASKARDWSNGFSIADVARVSIWVRDEGEIDWT